ncbi:MAG: hypothetical protein N2559_00790 [Anaerolineae bacterium]|nr:hypothetical protein [Anaerolineae bacterium]
MRLDEVMVEGRNMQVVTIPDIVERLQRLPPDKLVVVYDFVSYLFERETGQVFTQKLSEAFQTMLASESILKRDWERPEEDIAWVNL